MVVVMGIDLDIFEGFYFRKGLNIFSQNQCLVVLAFGIDLRHGLSAFVRTCTCLYILRSMNASMTFLRAL